MLKSLFLKIYVRQSLCTSCEPACNTHFSNDAFCITLMCTSSLFLLELPQFRMPYPQLLYMLWFMQFCSWYKLSLYQYNIIFKLVQNYWMEIKISVTVPRSVKQNKKVGQGIKKFDHNKAMPLSVKLRLTSKS